MNQKLAYVVLALISVCLSVLVMLNSIRLTQANRTRTCELLGVITSNNVTAPAHPVQEPSQEAEYQRHQRYVALDRSC